MRARRRRRAIRLAGGRCARCGTPLGRHADVHHRSYAHLGAERDGDLLALCTRCHLAVHGR